MSKVFFVFMLYFQLFTTFLAVASTEKTPKPFCQMADVETFNLADGQKICGRIDSIPSLVYSFTKINFQKNDLKEIQFLQQGNKVRYLTKTGEIYVADLPKNSSIYVDTQEGRKKYVFNGTLLQSIIFENSSHLHQESKPYVTNEKIFNLLLKNQDSFPVTLSGVYLHVDGQNLKVNDIEKISATKEGIDITYLKQNTPITVHASIAKDKNLNIRLAHRWTVINIPWEQVELLESPNKGNKPSQSVKKEPEVSQLWETFNIDFDQLELLSHFTRSNVASRFIGRPGFTNFSEIVFSEEKSRVEENEIALSPDSIRTYSRLFETAAGSNEYGVRGMIKMPEKQVLVDPLSLEYPLVKDHFQKIALLPYAPYPKVWGLESSFYIDRELVTNDQYQKFLTKSGRSSDKEFKSHEGNSPVTGLTYEDALAYATWHNKRLPTKNELKRFYKASLIRWTFREWAVDQVIVYPPNVTKKAPIGFRCAL